VKGAEIKNPARISEPRQGWLLRNQGVGGATTGRLAALLLLYWLQDDK